VEEHAGFSTQSARATTEVVEAYRVVLACELVAAVRALRLRGIRPSGRGLGAAFDLAAAALPPGTADRALDTDLTAAERLLPALADVADLTHAVAYPSRTPDESRNRSGLAG
jgi:histidine ammonia-lyase